MKFILGLVAILTMAGCSSSLHKVERAQQDPSKIIQQIDDLIVESKEKYINKCYTKVVNFEVPETPCEFQIFDAIERRYGLSYKKKNIDRVADELFFPVVFKEIDKLVSVDPVVRERVRGTFKRREDLQSYYYKLYSFVYND